MSESKHLKYPTKAHGSIPSFHNYEEEAEWWDENDTGEPAIEAQMTPVRVRSTPGYTRQMMLRLDNEMDDALEEEARERGMKKSTLARQWIKERLHQERANHAS
ncbi:MAG TPA: hypothetical protein DHW02_06280 [Ktedonobacter sp.]|nr:hypothetical protein [Ktedonobacter sp.]